MNESEQLSPLELAEQRIPARWYELDRETGLKHLALKALIFAAPIASYTFLYIAFGLNGLFDPLSPHVTSCGLYMLSDMIDSISTIKCFAAAENASNNGVQVEIQETSPLLAHIKTSREFIKDPRTYLPTVLGSGLSFLAPPAGLFVTNLKIIVSLSNFRKAERLNLAAEIAGSYNITPQTVSVNSNPRG